MIEKLDIAIAGFENTPSLAVFATVALETLAKVPVFAALHL